MERSHQGPRAASATSRAQRADAERTSRTRVLIVDDSAPFLELLDDVVARTATLEVAGRASSGEDAVQLTGELRPEIVIIDVNMPGMGGIGAAQRIKSEGSATVALISTTRPAELPIEAHAVADAVLAKDELEPELLDRLWLGCSQRGASGARDPGP